MAISQLAFHPFLSKRAPAFCHALETYLAGCPPGFSAAVTQAPYEVAGLAFLLDAPVLPVCVDEHEALLGPLHLPGASVCPECLDHWLDLNLYDRPEPRFTPGEREARVLADQLARVSSGGALEGRALSVAFGGERTAWHPVFPRRDCPRCGSLRTDASLRVHCSPWTGIVNRMQVSSAPSAGAYRATATWVPPQPVGNARPCLKRQESYGRGRTRQEAEAACVGEALERYSLVYRGDEPMVRAVYSAAESIHPDAIELFSESQYRQRDEWNAIVDDDFFVCERFQPNVPTDWLRASSLNRAGETRLVPAACCLMWYRFRPGEPDFARADTIGCGGGTSFEQALEHALLEWIERDAMAIWWDNRLRRPGVRLESFESRELDEVAAGLRAIGRDLFLLDCTTDIGIPAYVSVAPRFDGGEPLLGGAAHPSPSIAAYRAASEAGQVWYEAMKSGGAPVNMYHWLLHESTATQPYLMPDKWIDTPPEGEPVGDTLLRYIVERLQSVGLEAYSVDHSRPDVLSRTVRAIVPGLRHIWNRRAPGRLYEVPVKMGWLARPHVEEELNPVRCMI